MDTTVVQADDRGMDPKKNGKQSGHHYPALTLCLIFTAINNKNGLSIIP